MFLLLNTACTNLDRCPIASCKTRFEEDDIGCPICACVPFPIENVSTSKTTVPVVDLDVTPPESSQMGTVETSLSSIMTTVLESQIDTPSPSTADSDLAGDSIRADPDNDEDRNPKYQSFIPDVPKNYTIPNP
ncbi:uncharacterized protein LOC117125152 [Anneissia japonica]|uniref:uncharacterized protein LOC117125152 n=1 Tax=Anneissia japonica TaxID=1529436 RepID=UPI0014256D14|nr:uncharacterized protein LOC117125152 [Anneissia japonica]